LDTKKQSSSNPADNNLDSRKNLESKIETLLNEASDIARQSKKPTSGPSELIEIEHLFQALIKQPDPTLGAILQPFQLSQEGLPQSTHGALNSSGRKTLFVIREIIDLVLVVLVSFIIVKEGFGELRLIPSESMVPMLQIEDRVLIEKVTRWPVPFIHREYQRGDVLVFYPPMTTLEQDPWSIFLRVTGISGVLYTKEDNIDLAYIKRLIALPGDTLEVVPFEGVYINGHLLDEPYVKEIAQTCTREQPMQICGPIVIPEGKYFMMGDNRGSSADSRYWGYEPQDRVVGRAVMRVFPFDRFSLLPTPPYAGKDLQPNSPQKEN
jgi:signal peptidase I